MMKRMLVVGGANGIGLSIARKMACRATTERVYVVDKASLQGKVFGCYHFDFRKEGAHSYEYKK